jgi:hypothetical protein
MRDDDVTQAVGGLGVSPSRPARHVTLVRGRR